MRKLILIWLLLIGIAQAQSKAGFYLVGGKLITVQDDNSRTYLKAIENAGVVPTVTQNAASNFLVTSEKAIGSYSLMTAQYPIMGGTGSTHIFNLNNPNGLASGYTLQLFGTITHSASGMQGNGTTGYADTRFLANNLSLTNSGISTFINGTGNGVDIAAAPTNINRFALHGQSSSGDLNIRSGIGSVASDAIVPFTNFLGYLSGNKSATNRQALTYNNSIFINTVNDATGTMPASNVYLFAVNSVGTVNTYSNRRNAYFAIHQAFSDDISLKQSRIVTFYNSMQNR